MPSRTTQITLQIPIKPTQSASRVTNITSQITEGTGTSSNFSFLTKATRDIVNTFNTNLSHITKATRDVVCSVYPVPNDTRITQATRQIVCEVKREPVFGHINIPIGY
jgi:hypothetical protein